ncbi:dihydroorotate dehydrogenase electron transfer subunit [Rosistilla oblonga]|uniref:dihydroorotate dehydrogenase electron transfer subunit n=1 Tax=Rosistilla oblonga TaxID=2527990 RepID=UPI003A976AFB
MTSPLHAQHYADCAASLRAVVTASDLIAEKTYRLRLHAPEIASQIVPGQFVMIRLEGFNDPLIGRALAVYRVVANGDQPPEELEVVYIAKGKLTTRLARIQIGQHIGIWGPLGNGFPTVECEHLIMAAGGIGQTPFLALGSEALGRESFPGRTSGYAARATLLYGVRSASLAAGLDDFAASGIDLDLCTDDGSLGTQALVPDRLATLLAAPDRAASTRVVCCGPEIMMQRVAEVCAAAGVPCTVSLETPMACGIGICFSCVAKVRQADGEWDYKRTCVEGPVFDAASVVW